MLVSQTRSVYITNNEVKAFSVWLVKLNGLFYENLGSNKNSGWQGITCSISLEECSPMLSVWLFLA